MEPEDSHPVEIEEKQEQLITDFSNMFKKKGKAKKPVKKTQKNEESKQPNWLLQIPAKLNIERKDLEERKVLDLRRWMTQVKFEEKDLKILGSVVSAWNYLYSSEGSGNDPFIKQNQLLQIIGGDLVEKVKSCCEFQRVEIIKIIMEALDKKMNKKTAVNIIAKATPTKPLQESSKQILLQGLKSAKKAYIYFTFQDVFNPIGFEFTPLKQLDAYRKINEIPEQNQELWIITNGTGREDHSFIIKRWKHIVEDLSAMWPNYFDIKKVKEGVKRRPDVTIENEDENRGSSHCIIQVSRE